MLSYLHVKVDVDAVANSSGETLLDEGDLQSSQRNDGCVSGQIMSVPIPGNSIRRDSDLIRLIHKSTVGSLELGILHFSLYFFFPRSSQRKISNLCQNMNAALNLTREEQKETAAMSQRKMSYPLWGKLVKERNNKTKLRLWDSKC